MDSAQLYDKSVIARELNKVNGFSAKKIQQHYLMLDADRNPLFTIADIERFLLPTTPRSPFSPIPARTTDVHSSPPSRPLSPTSPEMATTLEVQLLRLSLDLERSLREKAEAFREKAEAERDTARARQENAELRAAAVSSRSPSHCSPRTSPRESAELTGREMLDRLSQCLAPPRSKPTDRYLKDSGVPTYDGTTSPDSFLQQFESMCAQFQVPRESQAVELIALLRGHARDWYLLQEGPLSIQALSLGLTHHFGKPYQAAKAVKDLYGYVPDATLSGPLRLLELNNDSKSRASTAWSSAPQKRPATTCSKIAFSPTKWTACFQHSMRMPTAMSTPSTPFRQTMLGARFYSASATRLPNTTFAKSPAARPAPAYG
jgi:hypothetical protein